jgi:hypothetical protein
MFSYVVSGMMFQINKVTRKNYWFNQPNYYFVWRVIMIEFLYYMCNAKNSRRNVKHFSQRRHITIKQNLNPVEMQPTTSVKDEKQNLVYLSHVIRGLKRLSPTLLHVRPSSNCCLKRTRQEAGLNTRSDWYYWRMSYLYYVRPHTGIIWGLLNPQGQDWERIERCF